MMECGRITQFQLSDIWYDDLMYILCDNDDGSKYVMDGSTVLTYAFRGSVRSVSSPDDDSCVFEVSVISLSITMILSVSFLF